MHTSPPAMFWVALGTSCGGWIVSSLFHPTSRWTMAFFSEVGVFHKDKSAWSCQRVWLVSIWGVLSVDNLSDNKCGDICVSRTLCSTNGAQSTLLETQKFTWNISKNRSGISNENKTCLIIFGDGHSFGCKKHDGIHDVTWEWTLQKQKNKLPPGKKDTWWTNF